MKQSDWPIHQPVFNINLNNISHQSPFNLLTCHWFSPTTPLSCNSVSLPTISRRLIMRHTTDIKIMKKKHSSTKRQVISIFWSNAWTLYNCTWCKMHATQKKISLTLRMTHWVIDSDNTAPSTFNVQWLYKLQNVRRAKKEDETRLTVLSHLHGPCNMVHGTGIVDTMYIVQVQRKKTRLTLRMTQIIHHHVHYLCC